MNESDVMIAAPIVAGIVQGAKTAGLPTDLAGPAAMVFAFGVVALIVPDPTSRDAALTAIVTGLTAAGLFSQAKYYRDRFSNNDDPLEGLEDPEA